MTDITPPPELVQQWAVEVYSQTADDDQRDLYIANRAAQYGADQELEACCEWLQVENSQPHSSAALRAARRPSPKPPSLKEQALVALNKGCFPSDDEIAAIRRALEQLDD